MSGLSTHILDTANGRPAAGVTVTLFRDANLIGAAATNADGRIPKLLPPDVSLETGVYRLVFDIAAHFPNAFFPEVIIVFQVTDADAHYHVPLLLSPFGYTTYRGS